MEETEAHRVAEKLYDWMNTLDSPKGEWVVDSRAFLPANVCCDFAGRARFIKGLAKVLMEGTDE